MRKVLFVGFFVMAVLAVGAMVAFACGDNATGAKTASSKSACTASKASASVASSTGKTCSASKANASQASSTGKTCTAKEKAACAAKASLANAEGKDEACSPKNIADCAAKARAAHAEACGTEGKCSLATISIKGMTCGNCETAVETALNEIEGVNRVIEVCYKAGFAAVCVNPESVKDEMLIKTVSSKGYQAEIIPAVATITSDEKTADGKASCSAHKDSKNESDVH